MLRTYCKIAVIGLGFFITPAWGIELPDLGEYGTSGLSAEKEMELGTEIVHKLQDAKMIIDDVYATDYLNHVARKLLHSAHYSRPVQLFWVKDGHINAFALPGGYIGVHTGLIESTDTENEFAAVLAHEIAHVQKQHIAQMYTRMQDVRYAEIAGAFAAIIVASQNPAAAEGILIGGLAAQLQAMLTFTRENEADADREAVLMLHRAGYNPDDMPKFFSKLTKKEAFQGSAPSYLRSHPLSTERSAATEQAARSLKPQPSIDSLPFQLVRGKLMRFSYDSLYETKAHIQTGLKTATGFRKAGLLYAEAMAHSALGNNQAALATLDTLSMLKDEPLLQGAYLEGLGASKGAAFALAYAEKSGWQPHGLGMLLSLVELSLQAKQPEKALALLHNYPCKPTLPAPYYFALAKTHQNLRQLPESHLAFSQYYLAEDRPHQAAWHLKQILRAPNASRRVVAEAKARLKSLAEQFSTITVDNPVDSMRE